VATRAIVKPIDVVGHVVDRQLAVLVDLFLDALLLETAEKGFGDRVVQQLPFRLMLGSRWSERQKRRCQDRLRALLREHPLRPSSGPNYCPLNPGNSNF
jgi:hypothetical protein